MPFDTIGVAVNLVSVAEDQVVAPTHVVQVSEDAVGFALLKIERLEGGAWLGVP